MTLNELITRIEKDGYLLLGKENIGRGLMDGEVRVAPLVLIPTEPVKPRDCVTVADYGGWHKALDGMVRIEGAAMVDDGRGGTVVALHFIAKPVNRAGV